MKYFVVQDLKVEKKVFKHIFITDFFFIVIYAAVTMMLGAVVHPYLKVAFYIFSGCCAIFLTAKSKWNQKRRNWESLLMFIRRDKNIYHPVINKSKRRERGMEIYEKNN